MRLTLDAWHDDGISASRYTPPAAGRAAVARRAVAVAPSSVVRVDLGRIDEVIRMVGELTISRARLNAQLEPLEQSVPVPAWRALQETAQAIERQLRQLRQGVIQMRLVPIGETFARMQFVVHDLARESHKQVALELQGQATEIDKFVVERMLDPLLHLVRNAVSHGSESTEERAAQGKLPAGRIVLRATTAGDVVLIEIEDDGRGIDAEHVAQRAHARYYRRRRAAEPGYAAGCAMRAWVLDPRAGRPRQRAWRRHGCGQADRAGAWRRAVARYCGRPRQPLHHSAAADAGDRGCADRGRWRADLRRADAVGARDRRCAAGAADGGGKNELLNDRSGVLPLLRLARYFGLAERAGWRPLCPGGGQRAAYAWPGGRPDASTSARSWCAPWPTR